MTTLTLWMKSGNQIRLPFIKDWTVEADADGKITGLTIVRYGFTQFIPCRKLIISSIVLEQIEAITR
jgi:hypothetical protein